MGRGKKFERESLIKTSIHSISILNLGELKLNLEIDIVDINKKGLIIRTYYPLEPGDILNFNNRIVPREGIVKWSNKDIDNKYSAGIHFIIIDEPLICIDRL